MGLTIDLNITSKGSGATDVARALTAAIDQTVKAASAFSSVGPMFEILNDTLMIISLMITWFFWLKMAVILTNMQQDLSAIWLRGNAG